MASLIRLTWLKQSGRSRILFANPDNLENTFTKPGSVWHDRKRLSVKMSYDECGTWPVSKVVEEGPSGYSDVGVLPDGSMLCIYECGKLGGMFATKSVSVAHFNLEWLTDGRNALPTSNARSDASPGAAALPPLALADSVTVNGLSIDLKAPPAGLVVRPALGLLTAAAMDGQVVHHARTPQGHLFMAWSGDDGRTWTKPTPSPLVHPDAPPMLFHLADWLQMNHCETPVLGVFPEIDPQGRSPSAVVKKHIRIEVAGRLLREQPRRSVTNVALDCGFSSSQYFAKVFRRQMGCMPRVYRLLSGK